MKREPSPSLCCKDTKIDKNAIRYYKFTIEVEMVEVVKVFFFLFFQHLLTSVETVTFSVLQDVLCSFTSVLNSIYHRFVAVVRVS